ncbi:hypothetical protein Q5Y75_27440 [Ruegeria sp. 2205SS24-7]|uniref:hypothetical protein n=1 Tax=Ruegeria discodermiae TaxID=3064389 RepID=UPI0027405AE8|nr:hypothetical protein [Ruegeria sp. 2205SS24-7]MDP5220924.1 hypothetical protein [Ruegeria sp. 2205SS24-7]
MTLRKRIEDNIVLWFLGATFTGFLGGIAAYSAVLEIARLEVVSGDKIEEYQAQDAQLKERLATLLNKERFLSVYLRYALAHMPPGNRTSSEDERSAARAELERLMKAYVSHSTDPTSPVTIGKGQSRQTTITFPDGSRWLIPPEFDAATSN